MKTLYCFLVIAGGGMGVGSNNLENFSQTNSQNFMKMHYEFY